MEFNMKFRNWVRERCQVVQPRLAGGFATSLLFGLLVANTSHASRRIFIDNVDGRAMNNVKITVEDVTANGNYWKDWQDLGSWPANGQIDLGIDHSRASCDSHGYCTGDWVYWQGYDADPTRYPRDIRMVDQSFISILDSTRVSIDLDIGGAHHYDFEDLGSTDGGDFYLELDCWNGTWNPATNQFEGDFLWRFK